MPHSPCPETAVADEESAYAPLRACAGLRELELPEGTLTAVPDVVSALTNLEILSFSGKLGLVDWAAALLH